MGKEDIIPLKAMESRKPIRNLFKSIHSLLGLKTQLTETWAESVCNIIKDLPIEGTSSSDSLIKCQNFNTMGSSDIAAEDDLSTAVMKIQDELAALNDHLNLLNMHGKQALNDLLELKGNIRVFCRIKPLNMMEKFKHLEVVMASESKNVLLKLPENKSKSYSFDKVFHQDSSQDEVFSEVEPVIKSALDGYNACIFAYGQTGTGKTFTMEGQSDCPGVIPRTIEALFKQAMDSNHTFAFTFSMLEIYMGNLRDLLVPQMAQPTDPITKCLSIQSDTNGGIEIDNLVTIRVSDFNQAKRLYRLGSRLRSTASTNSNATSSRSHCLIRISLSCFDDPERRRETNKIWMIDLGGSERVLKTKAWGKRLEEGKAINLSLSALGDVINALQRRKSHVPFRNSKLTQVLRDSLGEDSKTLMLVHVSPKEEDLCETVCSLGFATRVRSIHLGHEEPNDTKEIAMEKLLQKIKKIEFESQDVRRDVKKLNERLEHLTRSLQSPGQHLQVSHPFNEVPSNEEIEKSNHQDVPGIHSSKLPRFMKPTICSRKKSGMDISRKEKGQKKEPNHKTKIRRNSSLRAESISFPIKGVSESGSEYSISRNSCLVGPKSKYSADYETEYSYDTSECHIKLVVSPEKEKSETSLAVSRSRHCYEGFEGFGNGKEHRIDCRKDSTVDKWLNLQENEPTNKTYIYRGKRVVAIPLLEKKNRSNETEKTKSFQSEEVHNHEFGNKEFFDHNNIIKNLAKMAITQRSITELQIDEAQNSYENFMIDNSESNNNSLDHRIIEETQRLLDGFRTKDNRCTPDSISNMECDELNHRKDSISSIGMTDEQLLMDHETQCSVEDFTVTESGCNSFPPSDPRNNKSNLNIESHHHMSKSEQQSESTCPNEDAFLPKRITRTERKIKKTLLSDSSIFIDKRENRDFCGCNQYMEDLTPPELHKMRIMDHKDTNEEDYPPCFTELQEEIQNIGICDLLRQKIQLLHTGALLGLGVESLGLGNDFFYGLKL